MVDRRNKPAAIAASAGGPQAQVDISSDNAKVTATLPTGDSVVVLLHGASVISWKARGEEKLWLSDGAILDGSKAVRGGVPVVFPVFGPPPKNHATSTLPQHGFARNCKWEYLGKSSSESGVLSLGGADCVKLDFLLQSSSLPAESKKAWPYDFSLQYSVTLGKDGLQTTLSVRNEGKESFDFQMLLHTYFRVKDISTTTIAGLLGTSYVDKLLDATTHQEANAHLRITSEVDRVYAAIPQDTTTILCDGKPYLDVIRDNLSDTVVWNPWIAKAKSMGDFSPKDGYKEMLCIEVGAVEGWQTLEAGDTFEAGQIVKAHF